MGILDLTHSWAGIAALVVFVVAYAVVITEEFTHLRKSKPVMLAAGLIWAIIGIEYILSDQPAELEVAVSQYLAEFAELFLFLLVAMTYVNSMSERGVFEVLRTRLVRLGLGARTFFWVSGFISFFLSALIDNLTTALVMSGVILAVGKGHPRFIAISCVNIVVAANAGGAFSPFGDITTLMVWQRGLVDFGRVARSWGIKDEHWTAAVRDEFREAIADDLNARRDDLASANRYSATVTILENDGEGTFTAGGYYEGGHRPGSVDAADLDGDGYVDLAVANGYADSVSVILNPSGSWGSWSAAGPAGRCT